MTRTCYVPFCNSGYRTCQEKRHLFVPPRDIQLLERWRRAVPRADKVLDAKCRVCELHFKEDDILKEEILNINGDNIKLPRKNWALRQGAVPSIFPGCPPYLSNTKRSRKKPMDRQSMGQAKGTTSRDSASSTDTVSQEEEEVYQGSTATEFFGSGYIDHSSSQSPTISTVSPTDLLKIPPPSSSWRWSEVAETAAAGTKFVCSQALMCDEMVNYKSFLVDLESRTIHYHVFGRQYQGGLLPTSFFAVDELATALKIFSTCDVCPGVTDDQIQGVASCSRGLRDIKGWRAKNCELFFLSTHLDVPVCHPRQLLKNLLHLRLRRAPGKQQPLPRSNWRFLSQGRLRAQLKAKAKRNRTLKRANTRKEALIQVLRMTRG